MKPLTKRLLIAGLVLSVPITLYAQGSYLAPQRLY